MPDEQPLYWIAINGSSCAAAPFPLREPFKVAPTPEILVGFTIAEEAEENQSVMLQAPIAEVQERMRSWNSRTDVKVVRLTNPEPQTDGQTMWQEL